MCLAIPGKIVEISSDNQDSAVVDVVGVRRKIDLGLLQDDKRVPGRQMADDVIEGGQVSGHVRVAEADEGSRGGEQSCSYRDALARAVAAQQ